MQIHAVFLKKEPLVSRNAYSSDPISAFAELLLQLQNQSKNV